MEEVKKFSDKGGYVLGICNGFQVLCEAHLLPGALLRNSNQKFNCRNAFIRVETDQSPLTEGVKPGTVLKIPIAHAEGRYFADADTVARLNDSNQVLFRYCNEAGEVNADTNPNGAIECIAGICNEQRNVFGMMPHPERAADSILGNTDGKVLFDALLKKALHAVS
jgi:phosphoribosylformylglycinamidine synthase